MGWRERLECTGIMHDVTLSILFEYHSYNSGADYIETGNAFPFTRETNST